MSFTGLLDHKCDIYHIKAQSKSPGYGLPSSPAFSYAEEPDEKDVPCHFGVRNSNVTVAQKDPQAVRIATVKLALPAGTDVRLNDKIIDCETGYEYTAEIPRNIRGHHVTIIVKPTGQQELL